MPRSPPRAARDATGDSPLPRTQDIIKKCHCRCWSRSAAAGMGLRRPARWTASRRTRSKRHVPPAARSLRGRRRVERSKLGRAATSGSRGGPHLSLSPASEFGSFVQHNQTSGAQHSSRHNSMCPRRARARHPPRGTPQPGNSSDHPRRRSLSRFQAQTFIAMAADRPARHRRPFLLARRSRSHTAARRHPGPPAALKGAGGRGGRGRGAAARGAPGVSAPRRAAAEKK